MRARSALAASGSPPWGQPHGAGRLTRRTRASWDLFSESAACSSCICSTMVSFGMSPNPSGSSGLSPSTLAKSSEIRRQTGFNRCARRSDGSPSRVQGCLRSRSMRVAALSRPGCLRTWANVLDSPVGMGRARRMLGRRKHRTNRVLEVLGEALESLAGGDLQDGTVPRHPNAPNFVCGSVLPALARASSRIRQRPDEARPARRLKWRPVRAPNRRCRAG